MRTRRPSLIYAEILKSRQRIKRLRLELRLAEQVERESQLCDGPADSPIRGVRKDKVQG